MPLAHLYRIVQDVAGNAIPNVTMVVTRSDTGGNAQLWEDPGGLVPLSQPVLSDPQYGSLSVYVQGGEYDVFPSKAGYLFEPLRRITATSVQTGSFPLTGTGFTGTQPIVTVSYLRNGNLVALDIPDIAGVSNSVEFNLFGLPALLEPATYLRSPVIVIVGAVYQMGALYVNRLEVDVHPTPGPDPTWPATGNKGLCGTTVLYTCVS